MDTVELERINGLLDHDVELREVFRSTLKTTGRLSLPCIENQRTSERARQKDADDRRNS